MDIHHILFRFQVLWTFICCTQFCVDVCSQFSWVYSQEWNSWVTWQLCLAFSGAAAVFYVPVTGGGVPVSHSLVIAHRFYFSWPSGCEVGLHGGFDLQFPDDAEHLLTCLWAICMSFSERCLFKSFAYFLIRLFLFLLLRWNNSSYILDASPSSDTRLQIFSPILWLSFYFVGGVLWSTNVFHLDKFNLSIFVVVARAFGVII